MLLWLANKQLRVNVLGGYMGMGIPMEYLLVASVMVPFGSILISKILLPQTEEVTEIGDIQIDNKGDNANVLAALTEGGATGLQVAMSIGATIMVMISAVALINGALGIFGLSLQKILGILFAPLGAMMGLEGEYIMKAGELLGSKHYERYASMETYRYAIWPRKSNIYMFAYSPSMKGNGRLEDMDTFAVIGATIAENFEVRMPEGTIGVSILGKIS